MYVDNGLEKTIVTPHLSTRLWIVKKRNTALFAGLLSMENE
jgi:hypothetical protein